MTNLHTDTAMAYTQIGWQAASHETVNHTMSEYVRGDVTTNHAEGYFSQLKRSIDGTHHAVCGTPTPLPGRVRLPVLHPEAVRHPAGGAPHGSDGRTPTDVRANEAA